MSYVCKSIDLVIYPDIRRSVIRYSILYSHIKMLNFLVRGNVDDG